ncbi:MAG: ABC transporter ATP-binding protein [Pseudonocardia sp.]|nr:ABC transporter ATP-binding protein [Pseudonocardia sp.]
MRLDVCVSPQHAAESAGAAGPVVVLDGVTVRRGGVDLVADVGWRVAADERWVVLGPNGAGKTTLLGLAAARTHPTRGTVDLLGERLGLVDVFELRPRIGLAGAALADRIPAEETALDVVLTAAYAVVGRHSTSTRESYEDFDTRRASALLTGLGVGALAGRRYGTLSEGERKRVQVARALMTDPELLLLDEPAAGLDLGGREDLVRRLGALAADPESPAIVMVTHHVEEIPVGFTHALLLRSGRVVAQGRLGETVTGVHLSTTFGVPLEVREAGGRFSATML